MTHVKHLGFELEMKVAKITRALAILPPEYQECIVGQLSPIGLRRAVAQQLGIDLAAAAAPRGQG